jgi:hypothetical protein
MCKFNINFNINFTFWSQVSKFTFTKLQIKIRIISENNKNNIKEENKTNNIKEKNNIKSRKDIKNIKMKKTIKQHKNNIWESWNLQDNGKITNKIKAEHPKNLLTNQNQSSYKLFTMENYVLGTMIDLSIHTMNITQSAETVDLSKYLLKPNNHLSTTKFGYFHSLCNRYYITKIYLSNLRQDYLKTFPLLSYVQNMICRLTRNFTTRKTLPAHVETLQRQMTQPKMLQIQQVQVCTTPMTVLNLCRLYTDQTKLCTRSRRIVQENKINNELMYQDMYNLLTIVKITFSSHNLNTIFFRIVTPLPGE